MHHLCETSGQPQWLKYEDDIEIDCQEYNLKRYKLYKPTIHYRHSTLSYRERPSQAYFAPFSKSRFSGSGGKRSVSGAADWYSLFQIGSSGSGMFHASTSSRSQRRLTANAQTNRHPFNQRKNFFTLIYAQGYPRTHRARGALKMLMLLLDSAYRPSGSSARARAAPRGSAPRRAPRPAPR
jgi:hypothetical protein